jgi:hypothetical protein
MSLNKVAVRIPKLRSIRSQRLIARSGQHDCHKPPSSTEPNLSSGFDLVKNLREAGSRGSN